MSARQITMMDQILGEIGKAINTLAAPAQPGRPAPRSGGGELVLNAAERSEAGRLMRVNHAGEVAAQALYRGQALTARDAGTESALRQAAAEESDHLAWCETRIGELGGRPSVLNPLWYAGSFMIGALAGALGDRTSLGFVRETERQVESHLSGHLERLPPADHRSRAILEQMKRDEERHGASAAALGGAELPAWVRTGMRLTSRLMTRGSYWL
jgi:3-demethoxyubiquinol 3-hydroxylase